MKRVAACLVVLLADAASAKCLEARVGCLCSTPTAYVVKAHAIDDSSATVTEVFLAPDGGSVGDPDGGADAGVPPVIGSIVPAPINVTVHAGDWLLIDDEPRAFRLSSDGEQAACANVTVSSEAWASAVADGSCETLLEQHEFAEPACNDHGCRCGGAGGPLVLVALAVLRALVRRR